MTDFSSGLSQAVQEGNDQKVVQLVKEALAEGPPAMDILEKGLGPGVQARGQLLKQEWYNMGRIIYSAGGKVEDSSRGRLPQFCYSR